MAMNPNLTPFAPPSLGSTVAGATLLLALLLLARLG